MINSKYLFYRLENSIYKQIGHLYVISIDEIQFSYINKMKKSFERGTTLSSSILKSKEESFYRFKIQLVKNEEESLIIKKIILFDKHSLPIIKSYQIDIIT